MHISRVDLNLFTVFEAIYVEGSVTRASEKLNLTQPAISHALKRLRQVFDDPLFVRQGHSMVSTPLARTMIEPVRRALRGLEVTLNGLNQFDPTSMSKQFKLGLRDVLEATILPPLLNLVCTTAPLVDIAALQVERRALESALAAGTLDAAIDVLLPLSKEIRHTQIEQDCIVVVARPGHPAITGDLDLACYLKQEHILVSSRRKGPGVQDFELSRLGMERRIRLRCQHYFAACRVVSQTNLLLTMPGRYARIANQQFGNQILPFPLEIPSHDMYLYWHSNVDKDPANCWLREQIVQSLLP
ncbi:LysR family transcriptional regulator [Pseudomonas putida]